MEDTDIPQASSPQAEPPQTPTLGDTENPHNSSHQASSTQTPTIEDTDIPRNGSPRAWPPQTLTQGTRSCEHHPIDILALARNCPSEPIVFGEPVGDRPGIDRSPTRSDYHRRMAKRRERQQADKNFDPTKAHQYYNQGDSSGFLNTLRSKREEVQNKLRNTFSRANLSGGTFDRPKSRVASASSPILFTEGKDVRGFPGTALDQSKDSSSKKTYKRVKKRVKKFFRIRKQPQPQIQPDSQLPDPDTAAAKSEESDDSNATNYKVTPEDLLAQIPRNPIVMSAVIDLPRAGSDLWEKLGQHSLYPVGMLGIVPRSQEYIGITKKDRLDACMPGTMSFYVRNNTHSNHVYVSATGISKGKLVAILADGRTLCNFACSSTFPVLDKDVSIPLGPPSSVTLITVPWMNEGKFWICVGNKLEFCYEEGLEFGVSPRFFYPDVRRREDPNHGKNWSCFRFDFDDQGLKANVSCVESISIPIELKLETISGTIQSTTSMPITGLDAICDALRTQHINDRAGWDQLIVRSENGNLRVISPQVGISMYPDLFAGYYEGYVEEVWAKYSLEPLTVDCQKAGVFEGTVQGGYLDFGDFCFAKPSSADIFNCNINCHYSTLESKNACFEVGARLLAAFNQSTLLLSSTVPAKDCFHHISQPTNHYSRILHKVSGVGKTFNFEKLSEEVEGFDGDMSLVSKYPGLLDVIIG